MSHRAFWDYIKSAQFRFYQERDLSLDLCHNGWPGWLVGALAVATSVVFLLAIFHTIPARRHVTGLLLGLGLAAVLVGAATSYSHWRRLEAVEAKLIRATAGPPPATEEQKAAVVLLPLLLGTATLVLGAAGCLYMAVFWVGGRARSAG